MPKITGEPSKSKTPPISFLAASPNVGNRKFGKTTWEVWEDNLGIPKGEFFKPSRRTLTTMKKNSKTSTTVSASA